MATAYTSLLGLALPVTGELQGTWGTTVNDSITSLLDTAVAGTTTLSADTDVTLSTTTGAANQARQAILLCSGARTVLRTITAPAQSKIYTVINATTGGFSVKLVGVGPTTGVTIVAGESALVAWNGSDFIKISNTGGAASFTNVTVSGTTTLSGLTASTALALNGSKEVVSVTNTGTGNNVLSASPTLTGTISAAAATLSGNLTLSGGTANGVLYLDGSKVATSGSALTFDGSQFGVGTASGTSNGLKLNAGNAGANYVLYRDGTTGLLQVYGNQSGFNGLLISGVDGQQYLSDPAKHIWSVSNSEQMRLTSTGLGIGTTPSYKLDVNGAINIAAGSFFRSGSNPLVASNGSTLNYQYAGTTALAWRNQADSTELMRLDSSGNLGLGVTPSAWLSTLKAMQIGPRLGIYDTGSTGAFIYNAYINSAGNAIYSQTAAATLYDTSAGLHRWYNAPSGTAGNAISFTQAMTLDASGNLGLGVTPSGWGGVFTPAFQLRGASFASQSNANITHLMQNVYYNSSNNPIYIATDYATRYTQYQGQHLWFNSVSGTAGNAITFTQAMTLDASGNLGLGVTPSASNIKTLEINNAGNTVSSSGQSQLLLSANAYYNSGWKYGGTGSPVSQIELANGAFIFNNAPSGTAGNAISFTQAMTLDASGNLGVGETSPALRLHVKSASAAIGYFETSDTGTGPYVIWRNGTTSIGDVGSGKGISGSGNATDFMIASRSTYPLLFGTGSTERARITSGGDFGIGNNNPQYRLTVDKDTTSALAFFTNSNASAPNGLYVDFSAASPNNATQYFLYCEDSTAQRATIRSNGGLANYQSNNVDLSDSRTKKDIAPAASMWSKIGALEIVTYKYNDQTHDDVNVGVIAQQVEQVEPVWVDSDGFGETPEDGVPLKTVYTKDITFAAIKALQEAMTRIEQLEARVAALEAA